MLSWYQHLNKVSLAERRQAYWRTRIALRVLVAWLATSTKALAVHARGTVVAELIAVAIDRARSTTRCVHKQIDDRRVALMGGLDVMDVMGWDGGSSSQYLYECKAQSPRRSIHTIAWRTQTSAAIVEAPRADRIAAIAILRAERTTAIVSGDTCVVLHEYPAVERSNERSIDQSIIECPRVAMSQESACLYDP